MQDELVTTIFTTSFIFETIPYIWGWIPTKFLSPIQFLYAGPMNQRRHKPIFQSNSVHLQKSFSS